MYREKKISDDLFFFNDFKNSRILNFTNVYNRSSLSFIFSIEYLQPRAKAMMV